MTTSIKKALKRKTNESYRNGSKARKLIITLHTTDVIGIREEGCRGEEFLSIQGAYQYAIRNRLARERLDKGKAKALKKKRGY